MIFISKIISSGGMNNWWFLLISLIFQWKTINIVNHVLRMWQCALKDRKTRDQKMVQNIVTTLNKTKNLTKASFSCCMVIYLSLRFSFCFSFLGNYICVNYSTWRIHEWHFICTWLRLVNMSWHTTIKCTCRKTFFNLVHKQIIMIVNQYLYS